MITTKQQPTYHTTDGSSYTTLEDAVLHELVARLEIPKAHARKVWEKRADVRELLDLVSDPRPQEEPAHTYEAMLGAGDAGLAPREGWRTWTPEDKRTWGPVFYGRVEVRLRSGSVRVGAVDSFRWDVTGVDWDIVAWRPA